MVGLAVKQEGDLSRLSVGYDSLLPLHKSFSIMHYYYRING